MKNANWIMMLLCVGLLALVGCKKEQPRAVVVEGTRVDVQKLESAFATSSADLQNIVPEVVMGVRYSDYNRAFAALAKLDKAPGLTAEQKKVVAEVTEQIKQLATKPAAKPAP